MKTTYPGMHPKIEEPKHFATFHAWALPLIHAYIIPQLPEHYEVSIESSLTLGGSDDTIKRYRSDVEINRPIAEESGAVYETAQPTVLEPTFVMDAPDGEPQRFLIIRNDSKEIITTIEVLSPANKRGTGYDDYRRKQRELHEQGIHLVELDLLRAGKRRWADSRATAADYLITVLPAESRGVRSWTASVSDPLPAIPVPLREPDADVVLDVQYVVREFLSKSGLGERFAGK